ncbi:MAG: TolC family protein, partial [Planctomycetota bacterium]
MKKSKRLIWPALPAILIAGCASSSSQAFRPADWPVVASLPAASSEAQAPNRPEVTVPKELGAILRVALDRNPRIHRAREEALAADEVPAIEGWLPDPRILIGWYASPVETRVGPQRWSLGVQQAIPFPTKLARRSDLGETLAQRQIVAYERTVRDVLVEVVASAHELAYIDAAIGISAEIGALLERYVAATSGAESQAPLSELFRAETQRAQLENDRVVLTELRAAEAERLRALLDLPSDLPVESPDVGVVPTVVTSFAELLKIARKHNHELEEAGLALEAAKLRTSLAHSERWPDLTVGYSRIFTDGVDTTLIPAPPDNGRDAEIWHLGLTLPLWANKNSARVRRAEALERAAVQNR